MDKLLKKIGLGEKLSKNFGAIIIIAFAGTVIYGLPYFRFDYYDVYVETYHLTNIQMGVFGSVLGIFGMISYLFGGVVADKFSTRFIIGLSLIGTGLGGFIHLLPLTFAQLVCLYAFWGITSLFAFWPACVKAVRVMSGSDDQGKAFGFFEGGRGIAAALMTMFAVFAFKYGCGKLDNQHMGMRYVITFYSVLTVGIGILSFFVVKEGKMESSDKISFRGIKEVVKLPAVWIIAMVTFCTYVFTLSLYYFTPYSTQMLGATVTYAAGLAAFTKWLSLFGNIGGGYVTDIIGTGKILLTAFIVMAIGTVGILLLPLNNSSIVWYTIIFLIIYLFYHVNMAMTWAMMEEGAIPQNYSGTAAGIISTIGYLPEIFCSVLAGTLIDKNPGVTGFRYYFGFLVTILLIGAIFVLIWRVYLKKTKLKEIK